MTLGAATQTSSNVACEQALLFEPVKNESREARFVCPNRRACSQATNNECLYISDMAQLYVQDLVLDH